MTVLKNKTRLIYLFYFKNKFLSQHVIGEKEKSHEERQLGSLSQNRNMNIYTSEYEAEILTSRTRCPDFAKKE